MKHINAGVSIDKNIFIKICILWVENGSTRHLLFKIILNRCWWRDTVRDLSTRNYIKKHHEINIQKKACYRPLISPSDLKNVNEPPQSLANFLEFFKIMQWVELGSELGVNLHLKDYVVVCVCVCVCTQCLFFHYY